MNTDRGLDNRPVLWYTTSMESKFSTRPFADKIEFTNDGRLSLFFVGTGSAFTKKNFQNNVLVIKGPDHLLIDCGTLCPYSLSLFNSSIVAIQNFFISHSHADHAGGLEEAALMGRYVTHKKPHMVITDEYKRILWENTLSGGSANGERKENKRPLDFDDYFEQIRPRLVADSPRPLYEVNVGSINLKLYRTMHIPDGVSSWADSSYSMGVLIDNRILFPTDTRLDTALLNWMTSAYPVQYILHDCQLYEPAGVHTTYMQLKTLKTELKSKMFLCHYGDNYASFDAQKDGFLGFVKRGVYYDL